MDVHKILEGINGNPEVVIWNGYVDDYNNISKDVRGKKSFDRLGTISY